jgi:hypothetical protein
MPDAHETPLTEPEGVNAGPSVDEAERPTSGTPRNASISSDDLDRRLGEQMDGTSNGSELTTAGGDGPGPGQELSEGEG